MIPETGLGSCRFCGNWIPNPDQEVGVSEECPHCGKADPIEPLWRVRQRNMEEWQPKKLHVRLVIMLFDIAENAVSSLSGFICCALPVLVFVGYWAFKLIQYLWGVFF
jgi:hypothetical protein